MNKILQACEYCYKKPAEFLTCNRKDSWKFSCINCGEDIEIYGRDFRRIKNEDWLAHLSEKNWFKDTKEEFLKRYFYIKSEGNEELIKKFHFKSI